MAKLTTKKRNALSSSSFVFPKTRKFPINDRSHAANAKARASAKGGAVKAKVDAAVKRKFGFRTGGVIADIGSKQDHCTFQQMGIKR